MGVAKPASTEFDKSSGQVFEAMDVYFDEHSPTIGKSGVAPISQEKDREQPRTQPDQYMTPPLVASLPAQTPEQPPDQLSAQPPAQPPAQPAEQPANELPDQPVRNAPRQQLSKHWCLNMHLCHLHRMGGKVN
jgi:hypothetical protein